MYDKMSLWFTPFSDIIKKKVCRYLLHRYLGLYISEKISLDQLNVDFYNGKGTISNIVLSPVALNELCASQGWDFEVKAGHIGRIDVNIPWSALMSENSYVEICNLYIEIEPKNRPKDGASMIESMWSSMSSSMQLARDCILQQEGEPPQNQQLEGLERFAQVIDSVLNRIKVRLTDTEIRLEQYVSDKRDRGVALTIKIASFDYCNEAGGDPSNAPDLDDDSGQSTYSLPIYITHQLILGNVTCSVDEFRIGSKKAETSSVKEMSPAAEQFYSTMSELPEVQTNQERNFTSDDRATRHDHDDEYSDDEYDDDTHIHQTEPIQIACFQSIDAKIVVKQADFVQGPKVQLELQIGAVNVFLTPRQLHAFIFLTNTYATCDDKRTDANDSVNSGHNDTESNAECKSFNAMSGNLGVNQCWSSDPMHECQSTAAAMDSNTIKETSSMSNSITSLVSGYTQTTIRNRRRGIIEVDPNADILRTNIRMASLSVVLLEEDILVESSSNEDIPLSEKSVQRLSHMSRAFFERTANIAQYAGAKDWKGLTTLLENGCKENHIRVLFGPIIIEGEEQRNNSGILLRLSISIPRAEIREVLTDASVPLLEFYRDSSEATLPKRPEVTIVFKQTTNMVANTHGFHYETPKTELNIVIAPCLTEFDISIIDRLSPVLNTTLFHPSEEVNVNSDTQRKKQSNKCIMTLESPSIDVRLRFPCTDLRPIHTSDRVPWWKRSVSRDSLFFSFAQANIIFHSKEKYEISANKIDVYFSENEEDQKVHIGNVLSYERTSKDSKNPTVDRPKIIVELPSLEAIATNIQKKQMSDDSSDGGHHSDFSFHMSDAGESTPFSSKHVWRESDTPHSKMDDHDKSGHADEEKLLIPGDANEMNEFCDEAEDTSKLKITVNLPTVSLQLRTKHMYEVIYNRIISNLLLWTPSAPNATKQPPQQSNIDATNPFHNINMTDSGSIPFSMAKSNIFFDSGSSNNSDTDTDSENIFYSTYHDNSKRTTQTTPKTNPSAILTSNCAFRMQIRQGLLTAYTPVRDSASRVIPGQYGEIVMQVENLSLFSVSGYQSNENLNYLCIQASDAEIYHIGLVPVPSSNPPLRLYGCVLPGHLQSTIYATPSDLTANQSTSGVSPKREMLSIAIEIKSVPERKIKKTKMSIGLELATLRYNSAIAEHSWYRQIMDMFSVDDYVIQGYTPLTNIMEMHLHLWHCSVDYRPRFYDYRAILAVNTFMLSTTLSSTNLGCTVRFVAEDGTLSIAPHKQTGKFKFKNENKITSLPSDELVCVFEFALLEISLRESERVTEFAPKYDARAAMNGTHLRVCADSCKALGNLIAYIAAEGDLIEDQEQEEESIDSLRSSLRSLDADLLAVNVQNIPEVTEDQQQRVNQLMEEAMQDCTRTSPKKHEAVRLDPVSSEAFYFPDETDPAARARYYQSRSQSSLNRDDDDSISIATDGSRRHTNELQEIIDFEQSIVGCLLSATEAEAVEAFPLVNDELGVISGRTASNIQIDGSDTDDEFCFIGDEERPKCGIDNVVHSEEPIRIVDNHFSMPLDKHDMLKAPAGFPQAVTRYTICDLSISIHLYGGNDFRTADSDADRRNKEHERTVSMERAGMSDAYKKGVAFSKVSSTVTFPSGSSSAYNTGGSSSKAPRSWKERGGLNRNFDVCIEIHSNKGRFSYETYPAHTREASRQVLVLSDFEVWDRLTSSSFNKLFYTGRSERSKKSDQATMYVKNIFIRPEPTLPRQEANLYISFMPKVNINIDQDAIIFLTDFFAQLNGSEDDATPKAQPPPAHQPPVMIVEMPELQELQARKMVDENLMLLIDEDDEDHRSQPTEVTPPSQYETDNNPVYFRSVTFSPEVELTINYCGKRVQMSHGPIMGLIMGLSQLNCSKIKLKKIVYRRGLLGIDKVFYHLVKEWLHHIKNSQLPSLLQGIGPMNSIVIFFQGVIDLFRMPYEQYQRDGRIVRGIQLGAQSFTSRTALAALELTTRLIYLLQITAEIAYDMVSPGPSVRLNKNRRRGKRKLHRPQDIREGVSNAYYIVKDGVGDTAQNIVEMAAIEHDQKGVTGAVGAVIREIPRSMVMPLVLATRATNNMLSGVRNQLVPEAQMEAKEKYKEEDD